MNIIQTIEPEEYSQYQTDLWDSWTESVVDLIITLNLSEGEILIAIDEMDKDFCGNLNWVWKGFLLGFRKRYDLCDDDIEELVIALKDSLERQRNIRNFGV